MLIYKITNKINGKVYIGQTVRTKLKFLNGNYCGSGKLITQAVKKYGKENFIREVIWSCKTETQKEINVMEKLFIKKHNTIIPYGYNIALGGQGQRGEFTKEWKNNISKSKKGREMGKRGHKIETCQCCICKNKRGEMKGIKVGPPIEKHKLDCRCAICCGMRGEYKGKTKEQMGHKLGCLCGACKVKRGESWKTVRR